MRAAVVAVLLLAEGVHSWALSGTHLRASHRTRCAAVNLAAHMDVLLSELDTVRRSTRSHTRLGLACGA